MKVLAKFSKAEIARFYLRFVLMALCLGYAIFTTMFSDYGETGTYRALLWFVGPAAAYYSVTYARSLYFLHRSGNAMLWERSGQLYWLTDAIHQSPVASLKGAQVDGDNLRLIFGESAVDLKAKLALDDIADVVGRINTLRP